MDSKAKDQYERCMKRKEKVLANNTMVKFMLEKLEEAGCKVDIEKQFKCEVCPMAGAFDHYRNEMILCQNNIYSEREMGDTMAHELIHAFDHCRGHVDFSNPRHLACSEIRAANLSGDCYMWKEWLNRLNFGFQGQHSKCVKRKAARSMHAVTNGSVKEAERIIDEVWDPCFYDTAPYDKVP
eukprot:m.90446 g.90446  ORF g.90446 m.90446 type:complete len:182 (+) comp13267_c1_seq1:168-713(+)